MQVMTHVDILDLVKINVFKGTPTPIDPNPIRISIDPIDRNKNLVFDDGALNVLNRKMAEFVIERGLSIKEETTFRYVEEFVGRMLSELHKNGLVLLEEAPDAPEDPYKDVRSQYKN